VAQKSRHALRLRHVRQQAHATAATKASFDVERERSLKHDAQPVRPDVAALTRGSPSETRIPSAFNTELGGARHQIGLRRREFGGVCDGS
jgi:hypothetical protein